MRNYPAQVYAAGALGSISGVVATLPAGAILGEARYHNGIKYRLFYNDGGEQINPGEVFKAKGAGQGPALVVLGFGIHDP